jgi:outer membrane protein OmpA-like peptidoglycan-associated protein/outer membrane protein W
MHSKILRAMVVATLAAAPLAAQAGIFTDTAPGAQKGDWIVRAGVSQVNPKPENLKLDDAYLVVDSDVSFTFDVTYMFMEHFGVELLGAYPFKHGIDAKPFAGGDVRVGDTEHLPPTLSVVWRPMDYQATLQPYVGVGMNYTFFFNEQLRKGFLSANDLPRSSELSLDNSFGVAGLVGLDVFPTDKKDWFLNANVRWIDISSDAALKVPTSTVPGSRSWTKVELGDVDISPWVYTVNVGKRFGAPKPEPVAAPLPPPPPPPPPPPAKCADSDNDGVCDEADKCPNTPAGTTVDKYGCPCAQELKVLFDFDSAELRPESITELERVVKFMNDVPIATVQIDGHTDSIGTEEYNMKLSDRRAKAVFDYLSSRGVDPARMASKGFGESQPIAPNDTAEGRQLNRRVMLIRTDSCAK